MKAVSYWLIRRVALDLINFPVAHCFSFFSEIQISGFPVGSLTAWQSYICYPLSFLGGKQWEAFVLFLSSFACKSHEVEMAQEDERKGRSHLTDFIYFPKGYLHNASPDELFSQSELSSFMNCLSWRLPWWAFTTIWLPSSSCEDSGSIQSFKIDIYAG